jgi:hypothetical protein
MTDFRDRTTEVATCRGSRPHHYRLTLVINGPQEALRPLFHPLALASSLAFAVEAVGPDADYGLHEEVTGIAMTLRVAHFTAAQALRMAIARVEAVDREAASRWMLGSLTLEPVGVA